LRAARIDRTLRSEATERVSALEATGRVVRTKGDRYTLPARLDQALRLQLIVGGDDGVGTDAMTPRTLAHRRQPRARRHQTLANLLRIAGRQLFGEGGVGTA